MRGQEAMLIPVKFGSMRREVGHLLHPLTHQGPRASTSSDCKRQLNATLREIKFGDPDIRGHPNPN